MQIGHDPVDSSRIRYLDVLRGLMLVIMTFNHFGGPVKSITFQPLGFVSAAEGFIYLSGFVYGVVYTRKYLDTNFRTIRVKSERRASVIYIYHLLVLLIIVVPYLLGFYDSDELTAFREQPLKSFLLFAFLFYQPSHMDILPMYMIFILIGPYVLRAIVAGKWKTVFIISVLLWLINQMPVLQYTRYDGGDRLVDFGYFNIFCWQLLFLAGVFFGYAKVTGRFRLPVSKWTVVLAVFGSVICLIVRYMSSENEIYKLFAHFTDRSTLGAVRLVNFTLLAYLVYAITLRQPDIVRSGWLSLLGRHSLQVFAYSVCLFYFFQHVKLKTQQMDFREAILFDILLVATLTLPALFHQYTYKWFPSFKRAGL